jgi:hypothetical protein
MLASNSSVEGCRLKVDPIAAIHVNCSFNAFGVPSGTTPYEKQWNSQSRACSLLARSATIYSDVLRQGHYFK